MLDSSNLAIKWDTAQDDHGIFLSGLSSEDLMTRVAQSKDQEAFSILYYRHREFVSRVARSKLGQYQDVQDVVHQAFLNVWNYAHSWDAKKAPSFEGWLSTIARNDIIKMQTKTGVRAKSATDAFGEEEEAHFSRNADPNSDFVEELSDIELGRVRKEALWQGLKTLSEQEQDLILAFHIDGRTLKDCSEEFGIKGSAVRVRLFRARQKMKNAMLPCGEGNHTERLGELGIEFYAQDYALNGT